jgi:protein phosphatase
VVTQSPVRLQSRPPPPAEPEGPAIEFFTEETSQPTMPFALILLSAIGKTDRGRKRKRNEDTYVALPEHFLYAVADGMGGHPGGDVASQIAVDTLAQVFDTRTFPGEPQDGRSRGGDELARAVEAANAAIYAYAQAHDGMEGMGTTIVAARFSPKKQRVYVAHVGDSRCYRVRDRAIELLTTDHTVGNMLGVKGREANTLVRAVGIDGHVEVDVSAETPRSGDYYVLCSDGLPRMVPDEMIRDIVLAGGDIDQICHRLIETANERGGKDNITVIVVQVSEPTELLGLKKPSAAT